MQSWIRCGFICKTNEMRDALYGETTINLEHLNKQCSGFEPERKNIQWLFVINIGKLNNLSMFAVFNSLFANTFANAILTYRSHNRICCNNDGKHTLIICVNICSRYSHINQKLPPDFCANVVVFLSIKKLFSCFVTRDE